LTGVTGFLGKVLLERILYAIDVVEKVYILIRPKKGTSLDERFKKEILDTHCFDNLRERHGAEFMNFIKAKVCPVQGDVLMDGLGLSPADQDMLARSVNVIIHCAASIDFN
jgi:thioester reductase-like protein